MTIVIAIVKEQMKHSKPFSKRIRRRAVMGKRKVWILGTGYPWAIGIDEYKEVCLCKNPIGVNKKILKFPSRMLS